MCSQTVLFATTNRTIDQTEYVQKLISKERQVRWISATVFQDSVREIMQEIAKKISFFFPPPLIFVNRLCDYGRLNEFKNWTPMFERCRSATVVFVSPYSRNDERFKEEAYHLEHTWSHIPSSLRGPSDAWDNTPPRSLPVTNPGYDWCRRIPFNILHLGKDQDTLTEEQKTLVSSAFKPAPWLLPIQRIWSRFVEFCQTFILIPLRL